MNDLLDTTWLDDAWDFGDPPGSEARFRERLSTLDPASVEAAELTTQVARAMGLEGRIAEADALLDTISSEHPVVLARCNLERGRLRNSSGNGAESVSWFLQALEEARLAGDDYLAVDALHMLAIVDEPGTTNWMRDGLAVAAASDDPRARRWQGALHNNLGWTLHDNGDNSAALEEFKAALAAYKEFGSATQVHMAHWAVARCLRSLGRNEEALEIQQRLAAADPADPYVEEEIALLRIKLGHDTGGAPA